MVPLTFLLIPDAKLTDDLLDQVLPSSQARALVLPPALHPPGGHLRAAALACTRVAEHEYGAR